MLIQLYTFKLYLLDQMLLFIGLLGRKYTKSNIRIEVIYRFRFATWMVSVKMCPPQVRSYKKLCHVMMSTHNNGHKCEESISIICSSFTIINWLCDLRQDIQILYLIFYVEHIFITFSKISHGFITINRRQLKSNFSIELLILNRNVSSIIDTWVLL